MKLNVELKIRNPIFKQPTQHWLFKALQMSEGLDIRHVRHFKNGSSKKFYIYDNLQLDSKKVLYDNLPVLFFTLHVFRLLRTRNVTHFELFC